MRLPHPNFIVCYPLVLKLTNIHIEKLMNSIATKTEARDGDRNKTQTRHCDRDKTCDWDDSDHNETQTHRVLT